MAKKYKTGEWEQSLKLATKTGSSAVARRLKDNEDAMYGCQGCQSEAGGCYRRTKQGELLAEDVQLREQLRRSQQGVEIL